MHTYEYKYFPEKFNKKISAHTQYKHYIHITHIIYVLCIFILWSTVYTIDNLIIYNIMFVLL